MNELFSDISYEPYKKEADYVNSNSVNKEAITRIKTRKIGHAALFQ
jgi:hypothetical protein